MSYTEVGVGVVGNNPPEGVEGVCFKDILGGRGLFTSMCIGPVRK